MGALSYTFPANGDILSVINASSYANLFTRILVYLFPMMVLATTIPVFSIVVRYNLLQSKVPKLLANFLAVALPWIVVIPFLTGSGLNLILNWGTLIFSSIANFIIPFAVYIQSYHFRRSHGVLNENQKLILHELNLVPFTMGSINDGEDTTQYKAIPTNKYISPKTIALASFVLLAAATIASIGVNIKDLL